MRIGFVAAAVAAWAGGAAQPALAGWRYAPSSQYLTYWSTDVRRDGGEAEFSSITVHGLGQAGGVLVARRTVRVDCAWGVGRESWSSTGRPPRDGEKPLDPPKGWDRAKFLGDPQDPDSTAGFACADPAPAAYPTLAAAVKDGITRLGYPDIEAAYKVDTPPPLMIPPYRELVETPPPYDPPGPLDLVWKAQDKAVFLSTWSVKRHDKTVTGRAIWVAGAGRTKTDQVYLLRDFKIDCGSGAIAQSTRKAWPDRWEGIPDEPVPLKTIAVSPEGAEAALRATVCDGRGALRSLTSTGALGDYAAAPGN